MALLFAEGFDDFAVLADILTTAASAVNVNVITGRGGQGKGIVVINYAGWTFPASGPLIAGQALAVNSDTPEPIKYRFRQGSIDLFWLLLDDPMAMKFYNSAGTLIGSAAYRGWDSYIWVKLTPGTAAGHVKVTVDGNTVLDVAGIFGADGSLCDNIFFEVNSSNTNGLSDDLVVLDTSGARLNDILGDMRIVSIAPTGDGADTGWTPTGGGTHFNQVNESPIDYGATYVEAASAPLSDTYTYPALATTLGTVAALQVRDYATTVSGGSDTLKGIARIAGTDHLSAVDLGVHAVYTGLDHIFDLDPATGLPWTVAQVNAAEFGQKRTA